MPTLDTTRITGRIALPDDTSPAGGTIYFVLTGYDTDEALDITVLNRAVSGAIDENGDIDVLLWGNDRGARARRYAVSVGILDGSLTYQIPLGEISVPDSDATIDINDLLEVDIKDAAANAARIALRFNSVAEMVAHQYLKIGQVAITTGYHSSDGGGGNTYLVVPAGTGVADGGAFIDLDQHQAKALFPGGFKTAQQFGAKTDGSDCTAPLKAWLESGGRLVGEAGTYTVAAAGDDAGGVSATISKSINVDCDDGFIVAAGADLDNDVIRIDAAAAGYSASRDLSVSWRGGKIDQRLQKNSTSMPFPDDFPPPNLGTSATTDGLSIRGEISVGGTPTAGFRRVTVTGLQTFASDDWHWETAGGDGGLFVGGAVHIHVSECQMVAARDLGIYCSGLTAGAIPGGSCYIGANKLHGCMFGVSTKRLLSNVQMVDNIGVTTAALCLSTSVTTTGDNVRIAGNISYGAWKTIRATNGDAASIENNHSFDHGHFLSNGTTIGTPFTAGNCCVSLEGTTRPVVTGNSLRGRGSGFTLAAYTVLLGDDAASNSTTGALVYGNSSDGVTNTVFEESGNSDFMVAFNNEGTNLSGVFPVVVNGASSINKSAALYETSTRVTLTGSTVVTTLASHTIKANTMQRNYRLRVTAGGIINGTGGTKFIQMQVGAVDNTFLQSFDASTTGEWNLDFIIDFNTLSSIRFYGSVMSQSGVRSTFKRGIADFETEDNAIIVTGDLFDGSDEIILDYFAVRIE